MSRDVVFIPAARDTAPALDHGPPSVHDLTAAQADEPVEHLDDHPPGLDQTIDMSLLDPDDAGAHRVEIDMSISDLLGPYSSPATSPATTPSPGSSPASSPASSPPTSPRAPPQVEHTKKSKPVGKSKPPPRLPSARSRKAPKQLIATCDSAQATATMREPCNFREAMVSPDAHLWLLAMQKEIHSILDNATWILVPLPAGRRAVDTRWTYKVKILASGLLDCPKARFVAKGYSQIYGVDYDETYAPVVCMEVLRLLLAYAVLHQLNVHLMDVTTAFLHADIDNEIYVRQPEGFVDQEHPDWVCRLNKSLYGLKQAPLLWNRTINLHLQSSGFNPTNGDPCVYTR